MEDDGFVMPVNPSKPPPLYWGEVTIVKAGDPRRGQVGYIRKRDSIKRPNGQWNYHVSFPDVEETIEYQHDELFMGRA